MAALRILLCVALVAAPALYVPVAAQTDNYLGTTSAASASRDLALPGGRSYLGLNVARSASTAPCDSIELLCIDKSRAGQLYAGRLLTDSWRVEIGYLNFGRFPHLGAEARAQGLSLSLVGKARLGNSVGVFGKLGTTYGRTDTAVLGAGPEQGVGLSWGGGVSYDITSRLSATFEMDSHDLRFAGGVRDPIWSTNLGLQYRY